MTRSTVEQELLTLEKEYWPLQPAAQGVGRIGSQTFARMMKTTTYTLHDFRIGDDAEVRLLRDDVAVLACTKS
jgi:hypothetical protein